MKKIIALFFISINAFAQNASFNYPIARADSTKDNYFGQTVYDPYRWLETDTLTETKEWVSEENEYSADYFKKFRNKYFLEDQLHLNAQYSFGTIRRSGIYYFDFIRETTEDNACLYIKKEIDDIGKKIVDPNRYKAGKSDKVAINEFKVSDDNKYLAFSLSYNGSDWHEIHVMSLYPFHDQDDEITGVKFSNISWYKDGFFYTRYPVNGNALLDKTINPAIWYHKIGTTQDLDQLIFEDQKFSESAISFKKISDKHESYLIINHFNADNNMVLAINLQGNFLHWKMDTIIASRQKAAYDIIGIYNNKFLAHTTLYAGHGRLLLFEKNQKNKATDFIPEYVEVLQKASIVGDKIVCLYLKDIDYQCVTFDSTGTPLHKITFPEGSSVEGFAGNLSSPTTIFYQYSFLYPPIVYEYNVNTDETSLVKKTKITYDVKLFEIEKTYYFSKDGTRIPMLLAHKKGLKRDGKTPTILYGYGGYGMVSTPFYDKGFISFIQNGGIVAIPCLRGGGEYGEEWHKGGNMLNKENVFDDFIGAAEFLSRENYTTSQMLTIMGGSNGGLLVAAVLNRRPDICKVAIAINGVYDMLRYQEYTIGYMSENEFGSSKDASQFSNLYHYSPLHNIKDTSYPAILVITGDHDDRAVPMHSYKYVAALQKKNKSDNPVLLLVQKNAGHQDHDVELDAKIYSFIYDQLGIPMHKIHTVR